MPNKVTFEDFVSPPEKNEMQNYSFFISLFFLFSFFFFFFEVSSVFMTFESFTEIDLVSNVKPISLVIY